MRMSLRVGAVALCGGLLLVGSGVRGAQAQSLQQRIDSMRRAQAAQIESGQAERVNIAARLRDIVHPVDLDNVTLKDAIRWYSAMTGIPIVIDWRAMENEGVDPERRVTLQMSHVPAGQLLSLIMRMGQPEELFGTELVYETSPWYVQIMTKRQADRNLIVRVYEVGDLLMEVPNFTNAPEFDLNTSLSNTNTGGSSGGGGGKELFRDDDRDKEPVKTRTERGEELAQLIRDTVEPNVWVENGGTATIRYLAGRLIVSAPRYVHTQIGIPVISLDRETNAASAQPTAPRTTGTAPADRANRSGVSAVQGGGSGNVSRVRD